MPREDVEVSTVEESVAVAASPAAFDCQSCGACCSGLGVDVSWQDDVPPEMVKYDTLFGPVMRERKRRCIALKGTIGCSVSCRIYERRPVVCRDFEPGSDLCLRMRREHGIDEPRNITVRMGR
jgi:Fe-S-cluster containining protein